MAAADDEFRVLLSRRLKGYRDEEARIDARLADLAIERESVVARRRSAEELYESEFGESFAGSATEIRTAPETPPGPYTGLTWRDAMGRILADAGEPLHVKQIWARLQAGGFRTDSRDPVRSAVAILVQTPTDFEGLGHNRYALRKPHLLRVVELQSDGGGV